MRFLKHLLDFYINSSIHVALGVYALSWLTLLEFNLPYNEEVLYFIFYATITGYNFIKYYGVAKFHHRSLTKDLRVIQLFSFACFILMCFYAYQLPVELLGIIAFLAMLTFFYAIPFLPKKIFIDRHQDLRSIGGLKIYLIGLVWVGVTVVLPLFNADFSFANNEVLIVMLQRFLFVMVLLLPFEIRDLQYDSIKLSTVPQKIGVKWTKIIGVLLLVVCVVLECVKLDGLGNSVFVIMTLTAVMLMFSSENQNEYYSGFFVEGIPVLWIVVELLS